MDDNKTRYTVEDAESFLKDAAVRYELGQFPMAVYIAHLAKETFKNRYHEAGENLSQDLILKARAQIQEPYRDGVLDTVLTRIDSIRDAELRGVMIQTFKGHGAELIKQTMREKLITTKEFKELEDLVRLDVEDGETQTRVYELLGLSDAA